MLNCFPSLYLLLILTCAQDYQVDLYLQQNWVDSRLKNKHLTRTMDLNDPQLVQRIWKPEVNFYLASDI